MIDVMEVRVAEARYGVPLERVVGALPRVYIEPLPGAAAPLVGYLNYRGQPLAVIDLRLLFGARSGPPRLDEHLLVVRTQRRPLALLVDRALGLRRIEVGAAAAAPMSAGAIAGVLPLEEGLLLFTDLDLVLSLEEERDLDEALARLSEGPA